MEKCEIVVDADYTITGFLDGGNEECSSIQVNNEHTLSLEAEAIGKGLQLNSVGLRVPTCVNVDDELLDLVVEPANRNTAWKAHYGFDISAFRPDFMEYVERRQLELYFPTGFKGILTAHRAYCFKEELYNNKNFNWAEDKAVYMKKAIRRATQQGGLDKEAKFNFASYLGATLSLPKGGSDHGKRRTRSTRNVTLTPKKQRSDTGDEEQFGTVLEPTDATMNLRNDNRKRGKATLHAVSVPGGFRQQAETAQVLQARDETKDTVVNCLAALAAAVKEIAEMSEWNRFLVLGKIHRWEKQKRKLHEEVALLRGETNDNE